MAPRLEWSDPTRPPTPRDDHTGRVLGSRFRLDALLYETETASLYRAHDLRGGGMVAVKLLHPELDAARIERFHREGRILAKLRHPNIAEFIDCDRTVEGLFYIVTAFVDGAPLVRWCGDAPTLPIETVWRIGLQVAEALICSHAAGVIHRDVKASNIIWPASQVAKLVDFGIAKLTPSTSLELTPPRHPTAVGIPIGTEGYMPPEAGDIIDARTDVFALGRTLYRLLAHRPAEQWPAGLERTPEPLRGVIMEAGAPEAAWRPATMDEFRGRLLAAGAHLFPQQALGPGMRPARHLWPLPVDRETAPLPDAGCSEPAEVDPCTATGAPQLFERRLELRLKLADGRGGQTWRAFHHLLDCDVVVKIVPPALASTAYPAKLQREAAALQKLSHPAFPRVYECDYAEADGSWYLVEEYIRGETLSAVLKRTRLDVLVAVEIVAELAEALSEAHARGVLHGDVHPGNYMIEHATPPRARVIDLTDCRLLDHYFAVSAQRYAAPPHVRSDVPPSRDTALTNGRLEFVAPEVARGGRPTARSDVYSLGCILYGLLTGDQAPALRLKLVLEDGPREALGERLEQLLLEHAPELDSTTILTDLDDVLAPEPERRKVTMARFATILRETAESIRDLRVPEPSPLRTTVAAAPPPTSLAAAPSPSRSWSMLRGILSVALGATLVVGWGAWPRPERAAVEAPQAATPPLTSPTPAPPPVPPAATTPPAESPPPPQDAQVESQDGGYAAPRVDPKPRRERKPGRREPVTVDEATVAAKKAVDRLRACEGTPSVLVAQILITRGRGVVASLNFKARTRFAPDGWESCVSRELERVAYPSSEEASQLRVRLQLR